MSNEVLRGALDPACIRMELKAASRDEVIRELVGVLQARHGLRDPAGIVAAVLAREQKMSTSLENGLAVPHGKTDLVDRLLVAVGLKRQGIDFKSADGQPARIIILMVSPASQGGPHIRCLAEIGRLLQSEANRQHLLSAPDAQAIHHFMTEV